MCVCEHVCGCACTCVCLSPAQRPGTWRRPQAHVCMLPPLTERASWAKSPASPCPHLQVQPSQAKKQVLPSSSVSPGLLVPNEEPPGVHILVSLVTWSPPACLKREQEFVTRVEVGDVPMHPNCVPDCISLRLYGVGKKLRCTFSSLLHTPLCLEAWAWFSAVPVCAHCPHDLLGAGPQCHATQAGIP